MRVNVDGQRFNVPDDATPDEIDQISKAAAAPPLSPRQKMVHALAGVMPRPPGVTDAEQEQGVGGAVGMGMGMTMPNPLPFVGQFLKGSVKAVGEGVRSAANSMFPKAAQAGGVALDPVLQQAPRTLPALPKILEHMPGVGTPAKIYNTIRGAAESLPQQPPASPYPAAVPPAVQSVLPQATKAAEPAVNVFEAAGRGAKVKELVKAVDANASAHLGVDPLDPRFAEAIGGMPEQWWHGMAQVAKVNKPSADTIKDTVAFFQDRAAQALNAAK